MNIWFHGTNDYFTEWAIPQIDAEHLPDLEPHPFISLTQDIDLAKSCGQPSGGLCQTILRSGSHILNLRLNSSHSLAIWKMIKHSELGRYHNDLESSFTWLDACASGDILRHHTDYKPLKKVHATWVMRSKDEKLSPEQREEARLKLENFKRSWINTVIMPAKDMGFQAVICAETERKRTSINLYVFDKKILTPPEWLQKPNEPQESLD